MRGEVFVAAGAWVGLSYDRDGNHERANECYSRLLTERRSLVTTNLAVAEAHAVLLRRSGYLPAVRLLELLRVSRFIFTLYPGAELHAQAEAIPRRYSDQDFSLTDAVSFALMRERGICQALAFDHHFATAGFALLPQPPSVP